MGDEIVLPSPQDAINPKVKAALESLSAEDLDRVVRLLTPRIVDTYATHIPHPVQQFALTLQNEEVLFGGAAGGGKSDYLLMAALQYVDVPGYSGLLLRRTWPDLTAPSAILTRFKKWMEGKPVRMKDEGRMWIFPSGATIQFGTLQFHKDTAKYMSAEYQFIGFDELTHWGERTYEFMFSRLRRPQISCLGCSTPLIRKRNPNSGYAIYKHVNAGYETKCKEKFPDPKVIAEYPPAEMDGLTIFDVPLRMRSATNPGSVGHLWVKSHFIDPKTRAEKATFIPSLIRDNPSLDQKSYIASLQHLTPVDRERMLNGDWDVSEEGAMFKRHDFQFVKTAPPDHAIKAKVRFWDLAATVTDKSDWTVGALVSITKGGHWFVEDIIRFQGRPSEVESVIISTAHLDGRRIPVYMEQEPGSAGVNNIEHYRRLLAGFYFEGWRANGDKETRAKTMSVQAAHQNFYCVAAQWNMAFLDEFSLFPVVEHDDQVDACAHGFDVINFGSRSRLIA